MNQVSGGGILVERSIPTDPSVRGSDSLFLSEAESQELDARREMLEVGPIPATANVANRMSLNPGEPVLVRRRLMLIADTPVRIASSYFLLQLFDRTPLAEPDFIPGGLQRFFESRGLRFGRALETLHARLPDSLEAKRLQIDHDTPVVVILRTSYDVDDQAVHTLETICAADKHVFNVTQVEGDRVF